VTKTKVKRAVSKKSPIKAPEAPPQQGDPAADKVIADVIEEAVPGVAVS